VKSASGGNGVRDAAVSLTTAARQAAKSVCTLVDTSTTTSTTNTLVSRIANVTQINASSIEATGVCALVENASVSDSFGVTHGGNDNGIAAGGNDSLISMSDLLLSGGVAAFIGVIVALSIMYFLLFRRSKAGCTTAAAAAKTLPLIHHQNPMNRGKQQLQKQTPKKAVSPSKNDDAGKFKSAGNTNHVSDATTIKMIENPIGRSEMLPRRRSRGDLLNRV